MRQIANPGDQISIVAFEFLCLSVDFGIQFKRVLLSIDSIPFHEITGGTVPDGVHIEIQILQVGDGRVIQVGKIQKHTFQHEKGNDDTEDAAKQAQEYGFDGSFGRKNCLYAAYQHDSGNNGKEDTHKAFSDKTGNPLVNVGAFHEKEDGAAADEKKNNQCDKQDCQGRDAGALRLFLSSCIHINPFFPALLDLIYGLADKDATMFKSEICKMQVRFCENRKEKFCINLTCNFYLHMLP